MYLHISIVFFFNDTATTEIYTLSLHDALPICQLGGPRQHGRLDAGLVGQHVAAGADRHHDLLQGRIAGDRKSTRLNSSHANISYAVFCLKKKTKHLNYIHHHIMLAASGLKSAS